MMHGDLFFEQSTAQYFDIVYTDCLAERRDCRLAGFAKNDWVKTRLHVIFLISVLSSPTHRESRHPIKS